MINLSIKKRISSALIFGTLIFIGFGPLTALAAGNPINNVTPPTYTPLEPLPCIPGGAITTSQCATINANPEKPVDFQNYVQYAFNLFIFLCGSAAVFMIVWGGFTYMTTASFQQKSDGLQKAKNAVLGLILVLASYLLLRTIDPRLVALPTTLVKPLNIPYSNATNEIASDVQDAATYENALLNFRNNIATGQAQMQTLSQQESEAADNVASAAGVSLSDVASVCGDNSQGNDADTDTACENLLNIQSQKATLQGNINLNNAMGQMSAVVTQSQNALRNCDGDQTCIAQQNQSLSAIFNEYNSSLQPDQQKVLNIYKSYSDALVSLNKQLAAKASAQDPAAEQQAVATLNTALAKYSALPNADPAVITQMNAQIQSASASVKTVSNSHDSSNDPYVNMTN